MEAKSLNIREFIGIMKRSEVTALALADVPQAGAITERGAKNGNEKNVVRRGYVGGSI